MVPIILNLNQIAAITEGDMGGPEHRNTTTKINEHRKKSPRNTITATIIFIYIIFILKQLISKINASKRIHVCQCMPTRPYC